MAPHKTMAVSQQQQPQQASNHTIQADQTTKSKRRKGKSSSNHQSLQQQHQQTKVASVDKQQIPQKNTACDNKENLTFKSSIDQPADGTVIRKEEASNLKTQVQPTKDLSNSDKKRGEPILAAHTVLAKQISTEEQDDIDAGIELDGSSNSESSVKDPNEDQIKSVSVSPVMAQSNLVNENRNSTNHAVEDSPVEQLTGSLCTDITMSKKIGSTTKQQLAANQQVIDADEQSLQQRLQSKQRKSSVQSNTSISRSLSGGQQIGAPQTPASCKVCEQHVYQMERMMAEKSVYHKSCFRCYQCKIQLRVDNYSSHEGQVYCKSHHRQLFQPQVKLDNEDDVDIVAKSTSKTVDDYLLHRGRLSDLSYSFLQSKPEEIRKRQMIICENEPAKLPEDVVRSDSKVDDGFNHLSLNLGNIKERFERGANTSDGNNSQPSSAGVVIEKPSFNLKKTLMAFETKSVNNSCDTFDDPKRTERVERQTVKRLTNISGIFGRQNSEESESSSVQPQMKPLSVRRSESLMMRLRKYESRIAGDQVIDDDEGDDENNNQSIATDSKATISSRSVNEKSNAVPKKLASIDLSTLKSQWENGDISRRSAKLTDDTDFNDESTGTATSDNSPSTEKEDELIRVRQQLARKKSGGGSSSIKNIYENAIKEAQSQRTQASKLNSSDLSALNGFSTAEIQQQLLQNGSKNNQQSNTPSTPNKDHFQLNLSNKANKLRERFEQGLINNSSYDDSDTNDDDNQPALSKLEQLRQEKMDDLDWLTNKHEGEIKAREARSMFQQIDRRLSNGQALPKNTRSTSSMSASMQAKLQQHQQIQQTATDLGSTSIDSRRADLTNGRTNSGTRTSNQLANDKSQPPRFTTSFQ